MLTPTLFQRTGFIISLTLLLPLYLAIVLFTAYSFTGFFTDVIFFLLLLSFILLLILRRTTKGPLRIVIRRTLIIICCLVVSGYSGGQGNF
jgi:hypothetical protein